MIKNGLLTLVAFFMFFCAQSQTIDAASARSLALQNSKALNITLDASNDFKVSNALKSAASGNKILYLQQTYKQVPVYNQIIVANLRNDKVISTAGAYLSQMEERSAGKPSQPSVSKEQAIISAFTSKGIVAPTGLGVKSEDNGIFHFGKLAGNLDDVTAQLLWTPIESDKALKLTWQVFFTPAVGSDMWLIRVDAHTGSVVGETNLTVYCDWGNPEHVGSAGHKAHVSGEGSLLKENEAVSFYPTSPSIVNNATYLVVPYPAESPIHPGGTPVVRSNPWTLAPGNATSLKWNSDGTDYNYSRGNNAWAYEDRGNANAPSLASSALSNTPADPLNFEFIPDLTQEPTVNTVATPNQRFNITNLFYWNNILHDVSYQYGFDEVSGNFQENNQGRGGAGADYVRAEAQDGSGNNNANFSTPADGSRPRMQMYLWTAPNPDRDGDVDNGIILHEGGHGISNRMTGGPSQAGCLGNSEQMGEGWSDYYGLMATQNWATALPTDGFNNPRGIGTYALNQPITGQGIRPARYSTNFAVNNYTYANLPTVAVPHGVGFVWCTMLWDLTWKLIEVEGINPNFFDANGTGGNVIAMKLVNEAMKLQPCSPGFVDGRNAILQADQNLYGGVHSCLISEVFAKRGLGILANQGSSGSATDGTADFTVPTTLKLTENVVQVQEGQNIVYTNTVTTCSALANYLITDTLPANVTYVSGGAYNAGTRVVSFVVNQAAASTATYVFTVNVNAGSYFPPVVLLDDVVPGPAGPVSGTWTTTTTNANNWIIHNTRSKSPTFSYFAANLATSGESTLTLTNPIALGATPPALSFWHWYNTENTWDGGVLEISTNGGTTWADLGSSMTQNGYNNSMRGTGNPLTGRAGWGGNSNDFIETKVNLNAFANQNALFRFRLGSDAAVGAVGWNVDDIKIVKKAQVYMKSTLFNATGAVIGVSDTLADIVQATCSVSISQQPASQEKCVGGTATFTVTAGSTGGPASYQWQLSTDNGVTFNDILAAITDSYTTPVITAGMNNYKYRVIVSNACPSTVTSTVATLTIPAAPAVTTQPASVAVCAGANATFTVAGTPTGLSYQWQVSTNGGTTWTNIASATSATLTLTAVTTAMDGNQYRVILANSCADVVNSNAATLTVSPPAAITSQPASQTVCAPTSATFSVTATGSSLTYQWQVSTNGGTTFTNITSATAATYNTGATAAAMNGNQYRVIISSCAAPLTSQAATLTVSVPVSITGQPANVTVCEGTAATFTVTATGTTPSYQWQVSTDGGTTYTNITGATATSYSIANPTVSMNGNRYRVQVSNTCTTTAISSNAAILTVNQNVAITAQPMSTSACENTNATFTVGATGTGLTYQWQMSTGGAFSNITGATAATLTLTNVPFSANNNQYRVVIVGTCNTVTSNAATLTVNLPVQITVQPQSKSICKGENTSFSVTATGTSITYQWQVSVNGGPFVNLSNGGVYGGATTNTLAITNATQDLSGNRYRGVVTGVPCGAVNSAIANLTVNVPPVAVLTAANHTNATPYTPTGVYTTVSPNGIYTYTWFKNGTLIPSITAAGIPLTPDDYGTYQVRVTDINGCSTLTNTQTVTASASNTLFIYPNPNNGRFQVRYYNAGGASVARDVVVYNERGQRVFKKNYNTSGPYGLMEVVIPTPSAGTYVVMVIGKDGKKLATGKVIVRVP